MLSRLSLSARSFWASFSWGSSKNGLGVQLWLLWRWGVGRCHTAPLRAPHTQHHAHILQWTQCALHVFLCSSLALKTSPGLSPGCHESPTGTQVSSSVSASPESSPGPGTEKACLPPRTAIQQGHQGSGSDSTGTSWDTGVTESEAQFCEGCLQDSAWHPSFPSSRVLPPLLV